MYGKELILDIHKCRLDDCNREFLELFFKSLCLHIQMKREDLHFWDYEGDDDAYNKAPEHLQGISAVQFISTSNITIHTIDPLGCVYLNIFSCKDFSAEKVKAVVLSFFKAQKDFLRH